METKVQKWGNSLGVRIPRSVVAGVKLKPGSPVEISAEGETIVIRPLSRPRYTLAELLAGVSRQNVHGEVQTGDPVGKELL